MTSLIPDWLLVSLTGAALCCLVLGKWRWAGALAAPAILRFLLWPLASHYLETVPVVLLVALGLAALPFLLVRAVRRAMILASSESAADQALGHVFGKALASVLAKRRRR